jgi:hypothetical protein
VAYFLLSGCALVRLLGVNVDVLTPKGLPESFRAMVIAEAVPV